MFSVGDRVAYNGKHFPTSWEGVVSQTIGTGDHSYSVVHWDDNGSMAIWNKDLVLAGPEQIEDWRLPRV